MKRKGAAVLDSSAHGLKPSDVSSKDDKFSTFQNEDINPKGNILDGIDNIDLDDIKN